LSHYNATSANEKGRANQPFTTKAADGSPLKKKMKNVKDEKFTKEEPPSLIFLQSGTKTNPIPIGRDTVLSKMPPVEFKPKNEPDAGEPGKKFNERFAHGRILAKTSSRVMSGLPDAQPPLLSDEENLRPNSI